MCTAAQARAARSSARAWALSRLRNAVSQMSTMPTRSLMPAAPSVSALMALLRFLHINNARLDESVDTNLGWLARAVSQSDLDREGLAQYCGNLNIEIPQVFEVPVDGAPPQLGDQLDEDAEVALDVHVIATLVPNASIVSYMVCNTSRGFIDGLARAIYNESLPASTIAISYGAPEKTWTGQAISAIDDLLKDAAALNITVCCASGDLGSSDGVPGDKFNVDFPASSPHVLSCGGTTLTPNPENQAQPTEKVWSEPETIVGSGGGTSRIFAMPDWQQNRDDPALKNLNGRGVPDVAGFADSRNGYTILVSEQMVRLGGTSAAAPLWAGLIARINENMGKPVGYLNPLLYRKITDQAFLDIEEGSNGEFHAQLGWDACTGLGRPRGGELLKQLKRLLS